MYSICYTTKEIVAIQYNKPEPGVAVSDKYMAPGLEHRIASESYVNELTDMTIDKPTLKRVLDANMSLVGMENSREMFNDILKSLDSKPKTNRLASW